ncbi:MAG: SMC family ATPase [Chloroflexi bacterium]|nr:SMC family ATPase [Chloroflexota bacterium]
MVPIKLALRNFMCYRDNVPPLYFEGFHVACVCGDNGHGKSALLDAITWALWGEARAKSDDDLIYLGQSEMDVEFEFSVGQNRYRVLRKRTKGGLKRAGQSLLELQIATSDGFATLTGNTIRETERKITDILRMDYQTFINSALLLQGRASEFSMKKPGERKEVLANILGLSLYDKIERLAKDYSKEREILQQRLSSDIARIEQELSQKPNYEAELQGAQAAISMLGTEMEKKESALTALRQSREALKFKDEQCREMGKRIEQAERQLQHLNTVAEEHRSKIERYDKILSRYQEEVASIKMRSDDLARQEQDLGKRREDEKEISNQSNLLRSNNAQLKKEMDELKEKIDLLGKGDAECPLCGTELGVEGRKRIMANYETQGREKGDAFRTNHSRIQQKEEESKISRQEISKLETTITSERTRLERQAGALERERTEADRSLPQEKEGLGRAQKTVDDLRKALQEDIETKKTLLSEIEALPRLERELGDTEKAHRELRERERKYRDRLVEVQAGLRRFAQLETERETSIKELRSIAEEKSIYDELATAFGKRGTQALIIEKALPEIEEEANRLLGRMTDNRMHLKIESQRDTKKGDTIETLDIKIADELGTRNYEMFSGGEAFRVNFALRIALSKLLARRAGAPLPTLIIDEGFGTQDSAGREKLVEAINSIQDDFEKILVITHIEELKDAFPVRIDVIKTEEGSTFSLS